MSTKKAIEKPARPVLTRSTLKIFFDGEPSLTRVLSKWFEADGKAIILAGEEYDEHDVWLADNRTIYLVGTLTPARFKEVMHLRKGSPLTLACDASSFSWINHGWSGKTLFGKGVSAYDLGYRVSGPPFTYSEAPTA